MRAKDSRLGKTQLARKIRIHWIEDVDTFHKHAFQVVCMLNCSVADDGMLGYGEQLSRKDEESFLRFWEWQLTNRNAHILVAQDEIGPCAMAFMRTNASPNHRHIADLSKGFLDRRVRGSTLLRKIFARICEKADALGVEMLSLDTRENSRAYKVWLRYGFETYGTLEDYSRYGGSRHVGKYMHQPVERLKRMLNITTQGE